MNKEQKKEYKKVVNHLAVGTVIIIFSTYCFVLLLTRINSVLFTWQSFAYVIPFVLLSLNLYIHIRTFISGIVYLIELRKNK